MIRNSFRTKDKDPKKHLKLYSQGIVKLCDIHFIIYLYTDSYQDEVRFTLKEISQKVCLVNLKTIKMSDYGSKDEIDISDIEAMIKEQLIEN